MSGLRAPLPLGQRPGRPTSPMLDNGAAASNTHPCNDGATGQENTVRVGCSHSQGRALERRRRLTFSGHLPASCGSRATQTPGVWPTARSEMLARHAARSSASLAHGVQTVMVRGVATHVMGEEFKCFRLDGADEGESARTCCACPSAQA